jgi:hypothetical protein
MPNHVHEQRDPVYLNQPVASTDRLDIQSRARNPSTTMSPVASQLTKPLKQQWLRCPLVHQTTKTIWQKNQNGSEYQWWNIKLES